MSNKLPPGFLQHKKLRDEIKPALYRLDQGEGMEVESEDLRDFFDRLVAEVDDEFDSQ